MCKPLTVRQSTWVRQGIARAQCSGALMRSAGDGKMHASGGAPRKERGVQRANARSQRDAPAQVLGSSGVLMRRSQAHGWRMARQACVYARRRTGTVVAGFKVCSAPADEAALTAFHKEAAQDEQSEVQWKPEIGGP